MIEQAHIAELLCTRLCHDLTGPIGAVNNGAEFLSDEGFNMQDQAVELIVSSAFSAVTRLQFYRAAYGRVKIHGEANLAEKQKVAMDFFKDGNITLDWPDSHTDSAGVSISLKMARLLYNLLIVSSTLLIRGGKIAVRISKPDDNTNAVVIDISGPGLKWEPEIKRMTDGEVGEDELDPKNVQVYLTKLYADELNADIIYDVAEEHVVLSVSKPVNGSVT